MLNVFVDFFGDYQLINGYISNDLATAQLQQVQTFWFRSRVGPLSWQSNFISFIFH